MLWAAANVCDAPHHFPFLSQTLPKLTAYFTGVVKPVPCEFHGQFQIQGHFARAFTDF